MSVVLPAAQFAHAVFGSALKVPGPQATQDEDPGDASWSTVLPAGQVWHASSLLGEKVPAAHWVQLTLPGSASLSVTDPAEHAVQLSSWLTVDAAALNLPIEQSLHSESLVASGRPDVCCPAGHGVHALQVVSPSALNLPAAQGSQLCPSADSAVPAGQGPHASVIAPEAPSFDIHPALHSLQLLSDVFAAASSWNLPAAQLRHEV